MPTLHIVSGIATPALAPGVGRDSMVEIPPSSSVLAPGRPCLRSVPAHRIVGGGLGRRYDQAARLSDRHYACDRQRRSSLWVPPATSSLGGGISGSSSWAGPLLDDVRALAFPRDNDAAAGIAPPAAAAAAREVELHRIGGDGPELQPRVVGAGAVLGQVVPVVDLSSRLSDSRNNIGMLTSLCLEAMVNSWESVCGNYLYLPRAYHMPHELCARLLRLLITSRKLTAFTLSGFLNPAALELDLSGCSFVPKSVFKQLGFSSPRIVHLNLSMCTQVNNAIVRCVLQGCSALRQLYLDGCRHVTDAGFHLQQSPFYVLLGAVSLETISVQGCPQVVVIGAGMAGLSATRQLRQKGWPEDKVVLLEASGDIGGRMRTRRHRSGVVFDLGAAYVHGTIGNPLTELAEEAGIELKQVSESNPWVENTSSVALYSGGKRATAAEVAETNAAFFELMQRVTARAQGCEDTFVRASDGINEILKEEPFYSLSTAELSRLRIKLFALALWYGCDLDEMQLRSLGLDLEKNPLRGGQGVYGDFPGPHCVVEGGVERIAQAVANPEVRACLRLNSPVNLVSVVNGDTKPTTDGGTPGGAALEEGVEKRASHVSGTSGGVRVRVGIAGPEGEERGESVWADAVIVAVPLSLLQQGVVQFDPPIPEKTRSAMSRLRMGNYEKIIVEFEESFWPADVHFIGCCPQLSFPPPPPSISLSLTELSDSSPCKATRCAECPYPYTSMAMSAGAAEGTGDVGDALTLTRHLHRRHQVPGAASASLAGARSGTIRAVPQTVSEDAKSPPREVGVMLPFEQPVPILVENYLGFKGVPVLTVSFSGKRGREVAAAAKAGYEKAEAENEDSKQGSNGRKTSHAREIYRRLVKPALDDAFGRGVELPEPVSVIISNWANDPLQRGSYTFVPLGGLDHDLYNAGAGAAMNITGTASGTPGAERVFFAGEATIIEYEGSMHGAYLSGVRAVEHVVLAFNVSV